MVVCSYLVGTKPPWTGFGLNSPYAYIIITNKYCQQATGNYTKLDYKNLNDWTR